MPGAAVVKCRFFIRFYFPWGENLYPISRDLIQQNSAAHPMNSGSSAVDGNFNGQSVSVTFSNFPADMKLLVAGSLPLKDHAKLRTTNRAHRAQLTTSFVERLISEHIPSRGPFLHEIAKKGLLLYGRSFLEGFKKKDQPLFNLEQRGTDENTLMHCLAETKDSVAALAYVSEATTNRLLALSNGSRMTPLDVAIQSNNGAAVSFLAQRLIETHPNRDTWDANRNFAIRTACISEDPSILGNVLKVAGKNFEPYTEFEDTVLHDAAIHGRSENVKILIEYININNRHWIWDRTEYRGKNTILHCIVKKCDADTLCKLLDAVGDNLSLDVQNSEGMTPLHCAALAKDASIFSILLRWIAERCKPTYCWNAVDRRGNTVAHLAAMREDPNAFSALVEHAQMIDFAVVNLKKETPLHIAAKRQTVEIVDWLVKWIINNKPSYSWDALDDELYSAVLYAAEREDSRALRAIVTQAREYIDLENLGLNNKTVMHIAAKHSCAEALKLLADEYPNLDWVNQEDANGNTVLHCAARSKKPGSLLILSKLAPGMIDYSLKNAEGQTAAYLAVKAKNFENVTFLLSMEQPDWWKDADDEGITVGHLLAGQNTLVALNALKSLQSRIDFAAISDSRKTLLHEAAASGSAQMVAFLVQQMPESCLHCKDLRENTPLHIAARRGDKEVIETLLAAGMETDLCVTNSDGQTPLHLIVGDGRLVVFQLLLDLIQKKKIDHSWNIVDKSGRTPLMAALWRDRDESKDHEWIRMLANSCAATPHFNWSATDFAGETVAHLAYNYGAEVVKALFDAGGDKLDPSLKDAAGKPAILSALASKFSKVKHLYVDLAARRKYEWRDRMPNGSSIAHCALACNLEIVKRVSQLAGSAFDVKERNASGYTPLHYIVERPMDMDPDVVAFYIDLAIRQGYDWNKPGYNGNTFLHDCATVGHPDGVATIFKILGDRLDFSIENKDGNTCLHVAMMHSTGYEFLSEARRRGLPLNKVGAKGRSIWHFAAARASANIVDRLLENGCDLSIRDEEGNTPIHLLFDPETFAFERVPPFLFAAVKQGFDFTLRGSSSISLLESITSFYPHLIGLLLTETSRKSPLFRDDVLSILKREGMTRGKAILKTWWDAAAQGSVSDTNANEGRGERNIRRRLE